MKTVAVFGIGGFSGRSFERYVASAGLAADLRFVGFDSALDGAARTGAFTYRAGDALSREAIDDFIAEMTPAYVLNLIGTFQAKSLEAFIAVNVGISASVCEAVLKTRAPLEKLVLVGSAAEYGASAPNPVVETAEPRPVNPYGLSKLYQTLLARYYFDNHGLPAVVARTFNIVGEGLSPALSIGSFMRQIEDLPDGGVIRVGNIETSRDFLHIDEVSRRYWRLLTQGTPGEVYNICSGEARTIRSVIENLIAASGKRLTIEVDPARLKSHDVASIFGDGAKYRRIAS